MRRTCLAIVLVLTCRGGFGFAQTTGPSAGQVTIKGVILSSWHYYKHKMPLNQSPKGSTDKFELVLYAFDGPEDVRKILQQVLADGFPKEGLDADRATKLQGQFDDKLRYYVDTGDEKKTQAIIYDQTWVDNLASVTGTVEEKDGRKWISNAQVTIESRNNPDFKYPPDCMLRADSAFVMPKEKPVELKIGDGLTLKCVPIPPGTFIMGSPFYQCPRYQDECPHLVTLTKTFYLSEIPITQEMFDAVMGAEKDRSKDKGAQFAVEDTPFPDIREFCRIVSEKTGRKVRVPTAAEMEYVGRLGNSNPCFPAKYEPQHTDVAGRKNSVAVKGKAPNAWGIYDLPCWGETAVSDWKAPNRPDVQVDPQGEPFDSPWVYFDKAIVSAQKLDKPVDGMIMKGPYPAVHKGVNGGEWNRPNLHDRYSEDGLDGGNGKSWVGIFRVVVEGK